MSSGPYVMINFDEFLPVTRPFSPTQLGMLMVALSGVWQSDPDKMLVPYEAAVAAYRMSYEDFKVLWTPALSEVYQRFSRLEVRENPQ